MHDIMDKLLNSNEPSVRFKVSVNVLGKAPVCVRSRTGRSESVEIVELQERTHALRLL